MTKPMSDYMIGNCTHVYDESIMLVKYANSQLLKQ